MGNIFNKKGSSDKNKKDEDKNQNAKKKVSKDTILNKVIFFFFLC